MHEFYACEETTKSLRSWGFEVEIFCLGESKQPNALVATWGSGHPVIGIVGEYDALENLGQEAVPFCSPIPGPGHGCGHNLMGASCSSAAAALRAAIEKEKLQGTVKYFGCPAEETLQGKIIMDEMGLFGGIDICLNWHPGGLPPMISEDILMACGQWKYEFFGKTAHAAGQPWKGRSALDAAELMNVGVQFLREHVTDDVRIHYAFELDKLPANVVPKYAAINYMVRANTIAAYHEVAERVKKVAEGAAIMTETTFKAHEKVSCCEGKLNHTLNRILYDAAIKIPEIEYTQEEWEFARELYRNAMDADPGSTPLLETTLAEPTGVGRYFPGSSDLNPIMHCVPTAVFFCFGTVMNTLGHHWSQTACAGMSIGHKGALFAGKCIAQCGYDLIRDPSLVDQCWAELRK
jgi:aminobenzoyl-glutamate utilization protein B